MNPQDPQNLKRKLEQLEEKIYQTQPLKSPNPELTRTLKSLYQQVQLWYQGLPNLGKGAAIVVGGVFALSMVSAVLNLIRLAVTLGVLGVLGYVGYKLFLAPQSSDKNQQ